jgi:hypothetical protein
MPGYDLYEHIKDESGEWRDHDRLERERDENERNYGTEE